MPDVVCPLPEPLDYKKAKATYAQVRKDTNYKLSVDANRREAARRLNVDLDTLVKVLTTKQTHFPSPITRPVVVTPKPIPAPGPVTVLDYKTAKETYASIRKELKYKGTPLQFRQAAARRLNVSVEDFEKALANKATTTTKKATTPKPAPTPSPVPKTPTYTKKTDTAEDITYINSNLQRAQGTQTTILADGVKIGRVQKVREGYWEMDGRIRTGRFITERRGYVAVTDKGRLVKNGPYQSLFHTADEARAALIKHHENLKPVPTPTMPPAQKMLWPRKAKEMTPADDARAVNPGWERRTSNLTSAELRHDMLDMMDEDGFFLTQFGGEVKVKLINRIDVKVNKQAIVEELRDKGYVVNDFGMSDVFFVSKKVDRIKNTTNNCTSCTTTWELRRRGYDVVARTMPTGRPLREVYDAWNAWDHQILPDWAKKGTRPTWPVSVSKQQLRLALEQMEVGARGFITVEWRSGGAHIFNWEKRKDGKVWFADGQVGRVWSMGTDTKLDQTTGEFWAVRVDKLPDPRAVDYLTSGSDVGQIPLGDPDAWKRRRVL